MMDKYAELFNDITSGKLTLEEIKDYFNGYQCYIPKDDYGKLIIGLIGEVDFKIIAEIVKSRKGKFFDDYVDEFGEPMLHVLVLQLAFSTKFEEQKEDLFTFLESEDSGIKWNVKNKNLEDLLHIVCYLSNIFSKDDILRVIEIIKKRGVLSPLNRDDTDKNAIDVFKLRNTMSSSDEQEIINKLTEIVNESTIEVDNYFEVTSEVVENKEKETKPSEENKKIIDEEDDDYLNKVRRLYELNDMLNDMEVEGDIYSSTYTKLENEYCDLRNEVNKLKLEREKKGKVNTYSNHSEL